MNKTRSTHCGRPNQLAHKTSVNSMQKITLNILSAITFGICLCPAGLTQDAFDSTAATGMQTISTGNYTGSQTMQGGNLSAPMLEGATNGTIGPQEDFSEHEDGTYYDSALTSREIVLRDALVTPVACDEPIPQGIFPPMPQSVTLPPADQGSFLLEPDRKLDKKASSAFDRAKSLINDGNLQEAANQLDLAINYCVDESQMRKRIYDCLYNAADKLSRRRKWKDSEDLCRLAVFFDSTRSSAADLLDQCLQSQSKNPSEPAQRQVLAEQLDNAGNHRAAVAEWSAAAKLSNTPLNHAKLAAAYMAAGWERQANEEFRKAIALDWSENDRIAEAECHRKFGELFLKTSHYFRGRVAVASSLALLDNAAMEARRAVTLNPHDKQAIKLLNSVASEAVSHCPDEIDNQLLLAAAYVLKGDTRRAEMAYQECHRLDDIDPRLAIGNLALHRAILKKSVVSPKEELTESISDVEVILDRNPDNIQLWRLLGHLHEQQNESAKAKNCFNRAMALYWSGDSK